jgi:sulfur carrier protein ThiS adenylyltransferase
MRKNEKDEGGRMKDEERKKLKVESMTDFNFYSVAKNYYDNEQYAKIRGTRIGIAGAGGLGSNCAINLVRSGFEDFVIADFDVVEASNLNRQAYNVCHLGRPKVECLSELMRAINPGCTVRPVRERVDERNIAALFENCRVVVEAFDKAECKAMLSQAFMGSLKLVVSVSGIGGFGNSDRIVTRKIRDNYFLIGDGVSGVGNSIKPYAPCVNIAAAKQADVVLSWVIDH